MALWEPSHHNYSSSHQNFQIQDGNDFHILIKLHNFKF
jgi:hypothetical protein